MACASDLIRTGIARPGTVSLYITLSRLNAKKIIWPELCNINRNYKLNGKANESDLSIKFPNESVVYLSGASDKTEIEKFRGLPLAICYIDECQSFKEYLGELVDEVISKALFDYAGTLCLTGTPGPVPVGYFYNCSQSPNWSHHHWTMFDNPWLQKKSGLTPQELMQRDIDRMGVGVMHPTIQRECFGEWVTDENALVFRYNKALNDYRELPHVDNWRYIIGVDLGHDDADAIAVIGYSDDHPSAFLCEEMITKKQGITDLAEQMNPILRRFPADKIVVDTGGLGKKIALEMQTRFGIPMVAAEKDKKFANIEILNDMMRTRKFYAHKESQFAADSMKVEWDRDKDRDPNKPKVSDSFHSDICDAVLYAARETFHYLYEKPPDKIIPGSERWKEIQEAEMEKAAYNNSIPQEDEDIWSKRGIEDDWAF